MKISVILDRWSEKWPWAENGGGSKIEDWEKAHGWENCKCKGSEAGTRYIDIDTCINIWQHIEVGWGRGRKRRWWN